MADIIESVPQSPHYCADTARSIRKFQGSHLAVSLFQVLSTLSLLLASYAAIYVGLSYHWWIALLISPLASGLSIRAFILQHDCGHGSLFRSRWANDLVGRICSVCTLTPYDHWKKHHAIHHGSWNNMGTRGRLSDLYSDCMTVSEYTKLSRFQKTLYKISKNTIFSIFLMPPVIFFVVYRIAFDTPLGWVRERLGVWMTNLALALVYGGLCWLVGIKTEALVAFLVIYPAAVTGVWLFLIQHKFEGVHWSREEDWNNVSASLSGCSFLRLPPVLRWFTGDIGAHHVHHIAPGIPNYKLVECHKAHPIFQDVKVLTLRDGLREARLNTLWDEITAKMVDLRSV